MRRKQVPLVAPFAVAACFVVIRYVQLSFTLDALQKGTMPCFADLVIQPISGEGPISCSWFLAVGVECSMLSLLWERERSAQYVVLSESWRRLCAEELREAARVALGVGLAEFALICVSALIGVGASDLALLSFSERSSYFAYKTGHVLGASERCVGRMAGGVVLGHWTDGLFSCAVRCGCLCDCTACKAGGPSADAMVLLSKRHRARIAYIS